METNTDSLFSSGEIKQLNFQTGEMKALGILNVINAYYYTFSKNCRIRRDPRTEKNIYIILPQIHMYFWFS